MNLMSYLQIKIRLLIMNIRLQTAKKRVLLSVKNSRKTTDKMDYEYSRFLSLAEKREELYLQLIYVTNAQTTRPMLDTSFDTGIINVSKQAEETISDFDRTLALVHHRHGDWGDISAWDRKQQKPAIQAAGQYVPNTGLRAVRLFGLKPISKSGKPKFDWRMNTNELDSDFQTDRKAKGRSRRNRARFNPFL